MNANETQVKFISFVKPTNMLTPKEEVLKGMLDGDDSEIDFALPQGWVNSVTRFLKAFCPEGYSDVHIPSHFVWRYSLDAKLFGKPYPITDQGIEILSLLALTPPEL